MHQIKVHGVAILSFVPLFEMIALGPIIGSPAVSWSILNPQLIQTIVDLDRLIHHVFVFLWWIHHFLAHCFLESIVEDLCERILVFLV